MFVERACAFASIATHWEAGYAICSENVLNRWSVFPES
jgi:hypothetical protein